MKACVLGANGYLGRHVARALQDAGLDVVRSDRAAEPLAPGGRYVAADVRDRDAVARAVGDAELVLHFAGVSGTAAGFDDYRNFVESNEIGLLNVLDHVRRQAAPAKVVFPSSRLIYRGRPGPLREDAETDARTVYAANKLAGERYVEMYGRCFGVRSLVVRICVPYGELVPGRRRSYGTVGAFLDAACAGNPLTVFGGGEQRRSLIHVEDLARMVVEAAASPRTDGKVYNAGGPDDLSIREIAQAIAARHGVAVESRPWSGIARAIESGDTVFDSTALETLLGFRYRTRFSDWLAR